MAPSASSVWTEPSQLGVDVRGNFTWQGLFGEGTKRGVNFELFIEAGQPLLEAKLRKLGLPLLPAFKPNTAQAYATAPEVNRLLRTKYHPATAIHADLARVFKDLKSDNAGAKRTRDRSAEEEEEEAGDGRANEGKVQAGPSARQERLAKRGRTGSQAPVTPSPRGATPPGSGSAGTGTGTGCSGQGRQARAVQQSPLARAISGGGGAGPPGAQQQQKQDQPPAGPADRQMPEEEASAGADEEALAGADEEAGPSHGALMGLANAAMGPKELEELRAAIKDLLGVDVNAALLAMGNEVVKLKRSIFEQAYAADGLDAALDAVGVLVGERAARDGVRRRLEEQQRGMYTPQGMFSLLGTHVGRMPWWSVEKLVRLGAQGIERLACLAVMSALSRVDLHQC